VVVHRAPGRWAGAPALAAVPESEHKLGELALALAAASEVKLEVEYIDGELARDR
jgi:hypothetical protein